MVVPQPTISLCRDLAGEAGVRLEAALLAAYARVIGALTGDSDVAVRFIPATADPAAGTFPVTCDLPLSGQTWSQLMAQAQRALAAAGPGAPTAAAPVAARDGGGAPAYVLDCSGGGPRPAGVNETLLCLAPVQDGWQLRVRCGHGVRAGRERWAGGVPRYPDRVGGYFQTALRALLDDPGALVCAAAVISGAEERFQLEDLAGPWRELPDKRYHELFQERAAAHPDRLAGVAGSQRWTYAELNRNANRLAHALLGSGLRAEDVVAVSAERGLPWMAAVIAVFKAGAAYLPIEPDLPPGRVSAMLARSGCRFMLADTAALAAVDGALHAAAHPPAVIELTAALAKSGRDHNPDVAVRADQLAYIYFTSGSTGDPKGAMCEHAGMLNHLLAKAEDLGISPGQVVAQVAPQGFDISLWQLLAAPLTGGHTVIVGQDVVLDVRRLHDVLISSAVTVAQFVPSYLEALLEHAESEHAEPGGSGLGAVRRVSVTGEKLASALAERWFARFPGIPLVNAYGLTETSDDTNHETITKAPGQAPVPLGRPIRNVRSYLVNECLALVPVGSPGEIVFSGVCVGRGYVNDPERTRQAYLADPYRPGQRLYRSGDFGRWRPDGKLEYLGRRDAQVKVRGFRIETGEVESRLAAHPAVREAVVVVAGEPADRRRLAAFCTPAATVTAGALRGWCAGTLPEFMIPAQFHVLDRLPRTGNGKTDRAALTRLAGELSMAGLGSGGGPPSTPTERMLAGTWAKVLRVDARQISRTDRFFDLGGTSLAAVRLVLSMDGVSLEDVVANPVLADLATLIDAGQEQGGNHVNGRAPHGRAAGGTGQEPGRRARVGRGTPR
jgi:amino acid adenylation domain-containing protein